MMGDGRLPGRFSLSLLPRLLLAVIVVAGALDVVAVVYGISYHDLIQRVLSGANVTAAEAKAADDRQNVLGWTQLGLFAGVGIVFIVWFRLAYGNLTRLGIAGLRWRPYWAIVAWFIPIVNLFFPKRIANDIWRGSDPSLPAQAGLNREAPVPWFHTLWWALFVVDGIFDRIAFQRLRDAQTDSLSSASLTVVAAHAMDLLSLMFAFAVVYETAKRQRRRTETLATAAPPQTAPAPAT